jgi:hypothetical protein
MKALLTPGRFSTVPQGLLRPFHLDFSEIMAKIILFNMLKAQFLPEIKEVAGHARL